MIEFKCDRCESDVLVNFIKTLEIYADELGYKIDKGESIIEDTLQTYLMYTCSNCYKTYKLTLEDVESRIRRDAAKLALARRRDLVFRRKMHLVDEANGTSYCGLCGGVDDDKTGVCFNDLMKICSIRKNHLEK